jgi:diguanylate cyclase (GGDEF)-like protein/PAS domain S-box-containing protein
MAVRPSIKRPSRPRRAAPPKPKRPAGDPRGIEALIAAWPGPAAWLSGAGVTLSANAAAGPILDTLAARHGPHGLAAFVSGVCADGLARTDTIALAAQGGAHTFDVSFVPTPEAGVLVLARDVSLAANLRQALTDSRQRFKDLVEISSDFAWETDAAGVFTFVSPRGALGWRAADLIGRSAVALVADEDSGGGRASPFTTRMLIDQAELWLRRADGTPACVSISALPLVSADGSWRGARGMWRDVTEAHARDAALAEAENRERLVGYIVRTIRDEVEPDAMLAAAAAAAARALGAAGCRIWARGSDGVFAGAAAFGGALPDDAEPRLIAEATRLASGGKAAASDEIMLATPAGQVLGAVTRFRREINGALALWRSPEDAPWTDSDREVVAKIADQIGIAQEQIANHEALAKQARTDALTGLLNRRSFTKRVEQSLAECDRSGQPGTLVYVDLDNFKAVNDKLGHQAGDAALKGVATSLRRVARASDIVARLGGDEFALWLSTADEEAAIARAKVILGLKEELAPLSASPEKPLGLSVGLAVYVPARRETIAELIARADAAMYEVKRRGKGSYTLAPPAASAAASPGTAP